MTVAVCMKCGARKVGALTACRECGFEPSTYEDQAKSIALSDHYIAITELSAKGAKIKAGERPVFDETFIDEMARTICENPRSLKMPPGCLVAVWTLIIIMIILAVVVVLLFAYAKMNVP